MMRQGVAMQGRARPGAATPAATTTTTTRCRLEEVDHARGAGTEIRVRAFRNARHGNDAMLKPVEINCDGRKWSARRLTRSGVGRCARISHRARTTAATTTAAGRALRGCGRSFFIALG